MIYPKFLGTCPYRNLYNFSAGGDSKYFILGIILEPKISTGSKDSEMLKISIIRITTINLSNKIVRKE
jgi:hypothetical protein